MLSVKPDRPVDELTIAISREIDRVARDLGTAYFLAGAMARDILLTHVFGIPIGRATRDVDFGVAVKDWQQFDLIRDRLVAGGQFSGDKAGSQRVWYRPQASSSGCPVDIIPFGGVEAPPLSIAWPPDRNEVMSVVGYDEALASVTQVSVAEGVSVPIPSLPAMALRKLFAWRDRHAETSKDARRIASAITLAQARALLDDPQKSDRLATHMSVEFRTEDDSIGAAQRVLHQFRIGLTQQ